MDTLLFNYLHEFLYVYGESYFICHSVSIIEFDSEHEFKVKAVG